ncbi:MAG: hypothetical protein KDE51_04565 [Anaerolineales bacterium]|nr:hypothetical protein [Anaerolineales bacterium]
MTAENDDLNQAIEEIQRRWGSHSIGRLADQSSTPIYYPTSFDMLDAPLNGGFPSGRMSLISGRPTSGGLTMTLKTIAQAQQGGGAVLFIDLTHTFDPDYAFHADVVLDQLTVIRPPNRRQGLAILREAVTAACFAIIVLDLPEAYLSEPQTADLLVDTLDRLWLKLAHSPTALVGLVTCWGGEELRPNPLAHYAAVHLLIQRHEWLYRQGDINGYIAHVSVLKNRTGNTPQTTLTIPITFQQTVKGDRL